MNDKSIAILTSKMNQQMAEGNKDAGAK